MSGSSETKRKYSAYIKEFERWLDSKNYKETTQDNINGYMGYLRTLHFSDNTMRLHKASL